MVIILFKNLSIVSIGVIGIGSEGFEVNKSNNNLNIYSYEPEIKENLQIRNNFLFKIDSDIPKSKLIPKSKPIPIPKNK
jgi:hypothetical protein